MDEYTGNYFTIENSAVFDGMAVNVLEYKSKNSFPVGTCFRCGRVLRKHWWVVQTADDDLVVCECGNECVKHLT